MKKTHSRFLSVIIALALVPVISTAANAAVETYQIDPAHSSIGFKIRHFVGYVPGEITQVQGTLTLDRDNLENSNASASIGVGSINTGNENRDKHLKGADFFDIANYPKATFSSTAWKKTSGNTYDITGNLQLHGATKAIVLHAELLAFGPGVKGAQLCGWHATATLKKSDFGVNGPSMPGSVVVDDVFIDINVEAALKN